MDKLQYDKLEDIRTKQQNYAIIIRLAHKIKFKATINCIKPKQRIIETMDYTINLLLSSDAYKFDDTELERMKKNLSTLDSILLIRDIN